MKQKKILVCLLGSILLLTGCHKQEEAIQPQRSVSDTVKVYLEAIKAQDGLTMAEVTADHSGIDFTITEAEAQSLGLDQASMQKLYAQILDFDYTIDQETIHENNAQINVKLQAYDINQVLNDIVTKHEEAFGEINGEDLDEEAKNQKIADIMVEEFANAEKNASFNVVLQLQLVDGTWLINSDDEAMLFDTLFKGNEGS